MHTADPSAVVGMFAVSLSELVTNVMFQKEANKVML